MLSVSFFSFDSHLYLSLQLFIFKTLLDIICGILSSKLAEMKTLVCYMKHLMKIEEEEEITIIHPFIQNGKTKKIRI